MTNYDVIRVERKTAEYAVTNSSVQKRAQKREKITSGDYCHSTQWIDYNTNIEKKMFLKMADVDANVEVVSYIIFHVLFVSFSYSGTYYK